MSSCTSRSSARAASSEALLEPRRRIDRALWAVVMETYVHGVATRKVDDLVAALGIDTGISKSEVSRICAELDRVVATFRERRLDHVRFPYVFLDATYVKAHDGPSVVAKAIVVATGVTEVGDREVLGLAVGDSEDGAFWTTFLRSLRARGLAGVRLVISDAHKGLKGAIAAVLLGSAWQRSSVHSEPGPDGSPSGGRSEEPVAGVLTDAPHIVAEDRDGSLNSHHSTGHGLGVERETLKRRPP